MMKELTSQATQECAWSYVTKLTLSFMLYDLKIYYGKTKLKEICIQVMKILRISSKCYTFKASKDKKFSVQNVHMNGVYNVHEH